MQPLPLHVAERLGYIRFLHQEGNRQADRQYPLSSAAILSYHDALELFYALALDYNGVPVDQKSTAFDRYWPDLAKAAPNLASRRASDQLNRMRVSLKHHGLLPSAQQVAQARLDIATFLAANTPVVFGVDYESVSMADVIPAPSIRARVRAAIEAEAADDREEAMGLLAEAFHELLNPEPGEARAEALAFGPTLHWHVLGNTGDTESILRSLRGDSKGAYRDTRPLAEKIDTSAKIAQALQAALRVITSGIDYPAYLRFQQLTPGVARMMDNRVIRGYDDEYAPTAEHFQFCVQFVVSAALGVAEVNAYLDPPPWVRR